jgi:hypothetical protein
MYLDESPMSVGYALDVTGTVSCDIQGTMDILVQGQAESALTWFGLTSLTGLSADTNGVITTPVTRLRLRQASGNGSATLTLLQAGRRG